MVRPEALRMPRCSELYVAIVYRIGRKILNLESWVRFPVVISNYGLLVTEGNTPALHAGEVGAVPTRST